MTSKRDHIGLLIGIPWVNVANRYFKRSRGHVPRAKPTRRPRPSPRHSLGCRVRGLGFTGVILGLYIGNKGKENGNYCRVFGFRVVWG